MAGDDNDLPQDWIRKESRSKPGRFYYSNKVTGVSVWRRALVFASERERIAAAVAASNRAKSCNSKTKPVCKFKPLAATSASLPSQTRKGTRSQSLGTSESSAVDTKPDNNSKVELRIKSTDDIHKGFVRSSGVVSKLAKPKVGRVTSKERKSAGSTISPSSIRSSQSSSCNQIGSKSPGECCYMWWQLLLSQNTVKSWF